MSQRISDHDLLWPKAHVSPAEPAVLAPTEDAEETVINWTAVLVACSLFGAAITAGVVLYPPARTTAEDIYSASLAAIGRSVDVAASADVPPAMALSQSVLAPEPEVAKAPIEPAPPPPTMAPAVVVPVAIELPTNPVPVAQPIQPARQIAEPIVAKVVAEPLVAPKVELPAPKTVAPVITKAVEPAKTVKPVVVVANPTPQKKVAEAPIKRDVVVVASGDGLGCEELFKRGVVSSAEAGVKTISSKLAVFRACRIRPGEQIGNSNEVVELIDPKEMMVRTNRRVLTIVD